LRGFCGLHDVSDGGLREKRGMVELKKCVSTAFSERLLVLLFGG
jgi:hypothetical protein